MFRSTHRITYYSIGILLALIIALMAWEVGEHFPQFLSPSSILEDALILLALSLMISFLIGDRSFFKKNKRDT